MENKVTSLEEIKKLKAKDGEVIELPGFDENTPFTARVKRPSLMELCTKGTIPNPLLASAQRLFEGQIEKSTIVGYSEVMRKVVEVALVEPTYSEVKDVLTDSQIVVIFDYVLKGVVALLPFRQNRRAIRQNILADKELQRQVKTDEFADKVLSETISKSGKDRSKSGGNVKN